MLRLRTALGDKNIVSTVVKRGYRLPVDEPLATRTMSLLLVAHGTRKQQGVTMVGDLAERVSRVLGRRVHVAFVDVLGPTPQRCFAQLPAEPGHGGAGVPRQRLSRHASIYPPTWRPVAITR